MRKDLFSYFLTIVFLQQINAHGRLEDPPARNAAWRYGFNVPTNYDDVGLNCGGLSIQRLNEGKCGVCGDPYTGSRDHELGGKYATNTIVRSYAMNSMIDMKILLTANHIGFMELRLCPMTDPSKEVTQECLDENLLHIEGFGTQYPIQEGVEMINLKVHLPAGLSCAHCVLQWRYHAGNSWGVDQDTGKSCLGCGFQEEFYNCADISIGSDTDQIFVPFPKSTTMIPSSIEESIVHIPYEESVVLPIDTEYIPYIDHNELPITKTTTTTETPSNVVYSFEQTSDTVKTNKTHRCYPTNEVLKPLVGIEHWCLKLCVVHCPPTLCACVPI